MNFLKLTDKQKKWIKSKDIKPGSFYMFPRFGFDVYSEPKFGYDERVDTNPFFKSLDHEYFDVKEKCGDFYRGNFYKKPLTRDFYLYKSDLERRDLIESGIIIIFTYIPMVIYNNIKKIFKNK